MRSSGAPLVIWRFRRGRHRDPSRKRKGIPEFEIHDRTQAIVQEVVPWKQS